MKVALVVYGSDSKVCDYVEELGNILTKFKCLGAAPHSDPGRRAGCVVGGCSRIQSSIETIALSLLISWKPKLVPKAASYDITVLSSWMAWHPDKLYFVEEGISQLQWGAPFW